MSPKTKAMLTSFGRVFAAALLTAYLSLGKTPTDLRLEDLKALLDAALGALALTAVNYFRTGETRFGVGSEDIGMGGADKLEEPEGKINPKSLENPNPYAGAQLDADPPPEQTDNSPKVGEYTLETGDEFTGEMK
jgi:hypothetical protein